MWKASCGRFLLCEAMADVSLLPPDDFAERHKNCCLGEIAMGDIQIR
jgi:hypothetical protein